MKNLLRKLLIVVISLCILHLTACSKRERPRPPSPPPPPKVKLEQVSFDSHCTCGGARANYLVNDKTFDMIVDVEVTRTQHTTTTSVLPNNYVDKKVFIGCDIGDDTTNFCDVFYEYDLRNHRQVKSIESQNKSLSSCIDNCDNNMNCLPMGEALKKISIPLENLFNTAIEENKKIISVNEIKKNYGVTYDECKRKDAVVNNEFFSNSGETDDCTISAFEQMSDEINLTEENKKELKNVALLLPKDIEGERLTKPYLSYGKKYKSVRFSNRISSPRLFFTNDLERMNKYFAGHIVHLSSSENKLIIQTEQGCISSPLKKE